MKSEDRPVALINPNTDSAVTARMLAIAHRASNGRLKIDGITAPFGASLITNEKDLALAADAVASLVPRLDGRYSGIIVAAFGDPGAGLLEAALDVPVVGIGEAGLREAARDGRRFCVATTTQDLVASIDRRVVGLGLIGNYAGVVLTSGDAVSVTGDPQLLEQELRWAIEKATSEHGVDAVVIGGGPLGDAAYALVGRLAIAIVEPIPAAIRRLIHLIKEDRRRLAGLTGCL